MASMVVLIPCRPRLRARYGAPTSSDVVPTTRMVIRLALTRNGREYSTTRAAWKLPF
jgi:hypothetical protein